MWGSLTVQPPLFPQETDLALGVTPDEANNNRFFLSTLEAIDATELDTRKCVFQRG